MSKTNQQPQRQQPPQPKPQDKVSLYGSAVLAAVVVLLVAEGSFAAVEVPQEEVVQRAFAESGLTAEQWNELADDAREIKINDAVEAMRAEATGERQRALEAALREEVAEDAEVKMNGNGATACNVYGKEYKADKDGNFKVPARAVEHLLSHGFKRV